MKQEIFKNINLYPLGQKAVYSGRLSEGAQYIARKQLRDRALWTKFALQFGRASDDKDCGWRGEYWGKMMRGACIDYSYTRDENLYSVLEETVRLLLEKQDENGRISTYSKEKEFRGWDIWSRKYVFVGLLYFYQICKNEELKERILSAMCRQADYITKKVGEGEGKIAITATSSIWGGVNSCSILEPFVLLYKLTGKSDYFDFAAYLVRSGGCFEGNLIEIALKNEKKPHQYPIIKAYEVMSYFTGVLEYYTITGEPQLFNAVKNFVKAVHDNEITVIGCAGCSGELFDNASVRQTEYKQGEMQETCVTVTWMLLCHKMLMLTGESLYADYIERSGYNAMLGSINFENNISFNLLNKTYVDAVPFDSYSPLYMNQRGKGVGGYKEFEEGGFYGCCAAIGAAGISLMPATAVVKKDDGVFINYYLNGDIELTTPNGKAFRIQIETKYPENGFVKLILGLSEPENFALSLRLPAWSETNHIVVNGKSKTYKGGGFYTEKRLWANEDTIELTMKSDLRADFLNGCAAFLYGPLVLARDTAKEGNLVKIRKELPLDFEKSKIAFEQFSPLQGEQCRVKMSCGDDTFFLTDYASCGRKWPHSENFLTVWLPMRQMKN